MSTLSDYRKVSNIETLKWELIEEESSKQTGNTWWYNLSYDINSGEGSYLYKMEVNTKSKAHLHEGPEEFFILEGDTIRVSFGHWYPCPLVKSKMYKKHFQPTHVFVSNFLFRRNYKESDGGK